MINNISCKGLPNNTRYVAKNLIVGAKQGLKGLRQLKNEEGVNLILDVRKKHFFTSLLGKIYSKIAGIKRIEVPTTLGNKYLDIKIFDKASDVIINNKSGKTFLHCRHGKHRSVLVAAIAKIKAGEIRTKGDFVEFLKENHFFDKKQKSLISKLLNKNPKKTDNFNKIKEQISRYFIY